MTPYQYVSNNPIMKVEPTGMEDHDYRLNRDGKLEPINNTNDNFDRIFAEDNNDGVPLVVDKSFLKSLSRPKYEGRFEGKISPSLLKTYGKSIFHFFADNTDVEWNYSEFSNSKTGEKFGHIVTSFHKSTVLGAAYYTEDILDSSPDINWDYNIHNHPSTYNNVKDFRPSGWNFNEKEGAYVKTIDESTGKPNGDRGFYQSFKLNPNYNKRMPNYFDVYSPKLNKTIKYNNESLYPIN